MLPKWHVFWGLVFAVVLKLLAPSISYESLAIVFLASVLIDVDHYISGCLRTRSLSLRKAHIFHVKDGQRRVEAWKKKGKKEKEPFHLFHTIEFIVLVGIIGVFWNPAFYIFIGMVFHSLLDLGFMMYHDTIHMREFFFFNWIRGRIV